MGRFPSQPSRSRREGENDLSGVGTFEAAVPAAGVRQSRAVLGATGGMTSRDTPAGGCTQAPRGGGGANWPVRLRGLLCAAGAGGRVHPGWVASLRYLPPGMGQLWRSRRE